MGTWAYVRVGLIVFVVISSFFIPLGTRAAPPLDWATLLIIFFFCPVGLVFVLGLQAINPWSAEVWRRPSWSINPFNFAEPLQFFHLGAYVCLAQGLVTVLRVAASPIPFYVEAFVPLAMAGGVFLGLQVVMLLFRAKLGHGT